MYFDYFNVLIFAAVGFVFVFANMIIGSVIRPKRKTEQGREVYECGEETLGEAWVKFDIRYYTVALVYVIFAVEIAFLFPWAIVLKESFAGTGAAEGAGIGAFALVEGVLFIIVLFLGLAYVWAKGDLDWVLAYEGGDYAGRADRNRKLPSLEEVRAAAEGEQGGGDEAADEGEEAVA
ncbi:MAG: NADH-quinone oxidoreductase subunit A [Planctomycetes bacterium]|jgi:NADH-quinone oxidoreductase subunit A|nr:NADH-quinone oxidoreductase subunit A [Planctomycetota bacterium]MDP6408527.1 NADH-quinone oxidoreductase subunit A [Planctomycetota bacterium]